MGRTPDAQRRFRTLLMRRLREKRRALSHRRPCAFRALSLDEICKMVGLSLSPISSLNFPRIRVRLLTTKKERYRPPAE